MNMSIKTAKINDDPIEGIKMEPICGKTARHPTVNTRVSEPRIYFWVQAEWVLIFGGSFSQLGLIGFLVGSYLWELSQ